MECLSLHGAADGYYRTLASWSVSRGSDELSKQTRYIECWWSWWNSSPAHKGMQHQITPGLCMIFNHSLCTGQIPKELKSADVQCNIHPLKECKGGCRKFSVHLAPAHCEQSSGVTGFRPPFNHPKKVIPHLKHGVFKELFLCYSASICFTWNRGIFTQEHADRYYLLGLCKGFWFCWPQHPSCQAEGIQCHGLRTAWERRSNVLWLTAQPHNESLSQVEVTLPTTFTSFYLFTSVNVHLGFFPRVK